MLTDSPTVCTVFGVGGSEASLYAGDDGGESAECGAFPSASGGIFLWTKEALAGETAFVGAVLDLASRRGRWNATGLAFCFLSRLSVLMLSGGILVRCGEVTLRCGTGGKGSSSLGFGTRAVALSFLPLVLDNRVSRLCRRSRIEALFGCNSFSNMTLYRSSCTSGISTSSFGVRGMTDGHSSSTLTWPGCLGSCFLTSGCCLGGEERFCASANSLGVAGPWTMRRSRDAM